MSLSKLKDGVPTTVTLRKGSVLPGTKTHLQADNFGIQFKDLYKHLNHIVKYLLASPPPQSLTDNFKNPYTGETTLEMLGGTSIKVETAAVENDSAKSDGFFKRMSEQIKALFQ